MAKRLLQMADELDAALAADKPPTPQADLKTPSQRVLEALHRAPSYASKYPGFATYLWGNAMTRTQIRRALGNGQHAAQIVDTGLRDLMATGLVQKLDTKIKIKGGPRPEVFVLAKSVHLFEAPSQPDSAYSDPFSNEYVPPWRRVND